MVLALAVFASACDQGDPDLDRGPGPPLRVVATYPVAEQGTECTPSSPDDCGVPTGSSIQLRFDRYLLPSTAVRQSVRLYTGTEDVGEFLQPEYDLVERVLEFRPGELKPGVLYTVEIVIPTEEQPFGLRAFDGAPVGEGPVPLKFDFRTAKVVQPASSAAPTKDETPSCDAVLDLFKQAGCAGTVCHTAAENPDCPPGQGLDKLTDRCASIPRMGLRLDSKTGLLQTALGKVAHQTEIGGKTGVALESPPRLGVQMPIIAAGRPDNSYLMYKMLRRPDSFNDENGDACSTRWQVGLGPDNDCLPPPYEEWLRLRESAVRGDHMPPPKYDGLDTAQAATEGRPENHRAVLRKIQAWIRGGAPLDSCP